LPGLDLTTGMGVVDGDRPEQLPGDWERDGELVGPAAGRVPGAMDSPTAGSGEDTRIPTRMLAR